MKKYFVGMPVFLMYSFIMLFGIAGFIWECLDVKRFVIFAFITSVLIPVIIEIFLCFTMLSYLVIYDDKIEKKLFGKSLITFLWSDIKEIRLDGVVIYISKKKLVRTKKEWDKKQYMFIFYTEKLAKKLKEKKDETTYINF